MSTEGINEPVIRPTIASLSIVEHTEFVSILNFFETKTVEDISRLYHISERNLTEPLLTQIPLALNSIKKSSAAIVPYFRPSTFASTEAVIKSIRAVLSFAKEISLSFVESDPNTVLSLSLPILYINLSFIDNSLKELEKFVTNFERFSYMPRSATEPSIVPAPLQNAEEVEKTLKAYIQIGKKIQSDPNFSASPVGRLETLISNMDRETIEVDIKGPAKFPENLLFNSTFIALVAPSLCGKTQSAFAMQRVRPLYFALYDSTATTAPNQQKVYRNFDSLGATLENCAKKDLIAVKASGHLRAETESSDSDEDEENVLNPVASSSHKKVKIEPAERDEKEPLDVEYAEEEKKNQDDSVYSLLNSAFLQKHHQETRFFILGFLMKLMEEAENGFIPGLRSNLFSRENMSWMEFHALRTGQRSVFHFESISIKEAKMKSHLFRKYFVFLDEFVGHPWAVLVRNLCRALGIRVLVANTNSDIVNLTGKKHARQSRNENEDEVWALVVPRLNPPTFGTIEDLTITSKDTERDRELMRDLVQNLQRNQLPSLRPGIASMVLDVMKKLASETRIHSICDVLDDICNGVGKALKGRKRNIYEQPAGLLENLGLSLDGAYSRESIDTNNPLLNQTSYLLDHLYFLNNPVDTNDWLFMTFYPTVITKTIKSAETGKVIKRIDFGKYLRIFKDKKLSPWLAETTYFDETEVLTVLACMSLLSENSVYDDLLEGRLSRMVGNTDVGSSPNPEAVKLDGNRLEVLTTVSIMDSSRHGPERSGITLAGQSGLNFANNLVCNLVENIDAQGKPVEIIPPAAPTLFLRTLESFTVPFLYVANKPVPPFLRDLTNSGAINVGSCRRTTDREEIDIKFEIDIGGDKFWAAAECKNHKNEIQMYQIKEIILKASITENTFFSLIICNSILDKSVDNWASLKAFGTSKECNIYKLQRTETGLQWTPVAESTQHPHLVVLIYELDIINRRN